MRFRFPGARPRRLPPEGTLLPAYHRLARFAPPLLAVVLTLAFFWPLAFTDRILARGDTFAYFTPYWDARDSALRAGRLPLWSPDLFAGVPLLANSQLGTFYPPNWPLAGQRAPDAIRLSILLHVAWAFAGAYWLARRSTGVGRLAALAAALVYALSGHVGAHVEQINQLQGLAWLPWALLLLDHALVRPAVYTPLLGAVLALQLLSGHTQTVFITGVGLGLYGLASGRWRFVPILLGAVLLAGLLALPQLAPTLELTSVSNRSGGFSQNQATAFSFSPFVFGRGLLPSYDRTMFGEYVAYPGVIGLGLALLGLVSRKNSSLTTLSESPAVAAISAQRPQQVPLSPEWDGAPRGTRGKPKAAQGGAQRRGEGLLRIVRRGWRPSPRVVWAVVALVGLALAFGLYNPLYWALAALPGFNLFRVPARWLALFTVGAAMLAALGVQALIDAPAQRRGHLLAGVVVLVGLLAALSPLATRTPEMVPATTPEVVSFVGWALALAAFVALVALAALGALVALAGRLRQTAPLLLVVALALALFAAARVLPYNDLVPPDIYNASRFTALQLRAFERGALPPDRTLSISSLYFDPGDRATLEARFAALGLSPDAVSTAFTAIKMQETLAPNLTLTWGIPSFDGFDGGLLPTAGYTAFSSLLLPPGELRTLDGRLYELLAQPDCGGACLPESRWLNLTNTRYLITDKVYDIWFEGVAYDTQMPRAVGPEAPLTYDTLPPFVSTVVDVLYTCADDACAPPRMTLTAEDGTRTLPHETTAAGEIYHRARYLLAGPATPTSLTLRAETPLTVAAVTLVDTRTGDFVQLTPPPWQRVLSSDVKIYENADVQPRAFVVHDWTATGGDWQGTEDALALMRDPAFDPARTAVLTGDVPPSGAVPAGESTARITRYEAERIDVEVEAAETGYLLLTDAFYPGWTATVDGAPAEVVRADVLFRAVHVLAGRSVVTFEYRPAWLPGALIGGAAAWVLAAVFVVFAMSRRNNNSSERE